MPSEKMYEAKFNKVILGVVQFISNCVPDSFFGKHKESIKSFVEEKPAEPIAYFLKYVYDNDTYREKLLNMDDSYFLNQDFQEVISDNPFKKETEVYVKKMFYFRNLWLSFDETSKDLIRRSMISLLKISEKYIDVLYSTRVLGTDDSAPTLVTGDDTKTQGSIYVDKRMKKAKRDKRHKQHKQHAKRLESIKEYEADSISVGSHKSNDKYSTDSISIGSDKRRRKKKTKTSVKKNK